MHDRRHPMLGEGAAEPGPVGEVALDERPPAHRRALPARQIVEHDRTLAGLGQHLAGVRADIARPAGYQHRLRHAALPDWTIDCMIIAS